MYQNYFKHYIEYAILAIRRILHEKDFYKSQIVRLQTSG